MTVCIASFLIANSEDFGEGALLYGVCDGGHERELEVMLGDIVEEHKSCHCATVRKRGEKGHQSTFI